MELIGPEPNDPQKDSTKATRRGVLGLVATAGVGAAGGYYGLRSMTQTAEASANLSFEDGSITLDEDDSISTVTISGTVDATYDAGGDNADNAGMTVSLSSDSVSTPDAKIFSYEDIDPDSESITQDVSFTFDLPPEVADPDPGEATETEFSVEVFFGVDRAEAEDGDLVIIETRENDTATLHIEREEDTTTPEYPEASVDGTFTFDFETE